MDVPVPVINRLRRTLRDIVDLNVLLNGQQESDDQTLAEALADALADFNGAPPYMAGFQLNFWSFFDQASGLPTEDSKLLNVLHQVIRRAAVTVLQSVSTMMQRNELQYTAGNSTVSTNDKWRNLQTTIQQYQSEYEDRRDRIKQQINLEQFFNAIHSNLSNVLRGSIPYLSVF